MKIYHVVAMAKYRVIGKNNQLPWHYSSDLKNFKELTMNSTVIMGRKTYESIGRPLPQRINFVLTHNPNFKTHGIQTFASFIEAIKSVKTEKAFVIGGGQLYRETLPLVDGIYLTVIDEAYGGDTFYPDLPDCFLTKEIKRLQDNPKIEVIYYENTKREVFHRG